MSDPIYDKYIASMRACIDSYGAQNTIHALSEAFRLESEVIENDERKQKYLLAVSGKIAEVYYQVETL